MRAKPDVIRKFKKTMEPSLLTSFIGIIVFSALMTVGYKYANGKWNVSENKKNDYMIWVNKHGQTVKRSVVFLSIIYGLSMLIQIISLL